MIYQFKAGQTYRGLKAQEVGEELSRIRLKNSGRLHTDEVVKEAAKKTSPIHRAFTWDDAVAGHQYRLDEARRLIRIIVVERSDDAGKDDRHHAFFNVRIAMPQEEENAEPEFEQYYQAADVLVKNPEEYESALDGMRRELLSAEKGLTELLNIAPKKERPRVKQAAAHVTRASETLSA